MLLNAGPLNAAVLNSSGAGNGSTQNLATLLQASASIDLALARQGFALVAGLQAAATAPTARPGAAQPLGGQLEASGVISTAVLNRNSGALASTITASGAAPAARLALSISVAGQLSGAGSSSGALARLVALSGAPMAASAVVGSSALFRSAGPLAASVQAEAATLGRFFQAHALAGALSGSATVTPTLYWDNPLQATEISVQALIDRADLSLTHHHLRASVAVSAQAQASDPVSGAALRAILEVEGRVGSSVLEVTNRGRLRARLDAAAYVSGNMPWSRRLSASIQAFGFIPFNRLDAGPDVSGLISAVAIVPRAALSNGRNFDGLVLSRAEVSATTSVHVGLYPQAPKAKAIISKSVLKTNFERLFASAEVAATVEEATLDNGVKSLKVYAEIRAFFLVAQLETSEKRLSARIECDAFARDGSVGSPRFEPLPRPPLRASLHCALDAVGELRGGALKLRAALGCSAQATGEWGTPPDLKNLSGFLYAQADAAAQIRTSRVELRGLLEARATTYDRFDKWPDIRLLKSERNFATATKFAAHLHSPIQLLFADLLPTANVGRSGLGYVVGLAGSLAASASVGALPLVSRRLYGHIGTTSSASGYVTNRGALQAFFNDAIAEAEARPHVAYSLAATAPCSAAVTPNMQQRIDFASAPIILAAVNGRLSAHYRGVDVEGPTSTFAEVTADAVYAEVWPSLVEYRKAA